MKPTRSVLAVIAMIGALGSACAPPPELPASPIAFTGHVVDHALTKAAFVVAGQMVGDAKPDLVASSFDTTTGPGYVTAYEQGADLDHWTRHDVVTPADGIRFPNEPTIADLDGDGDSDLIVPGGFFICEFTFSPCGSLQWFEQTPGGWSRHDIVTPGQSAFYHRAVLDDVDHDGITDLVTVGETSSSATAMWYPGVAGPQRFSSAARVIGPGGGSLFRVADVDGDGDTDVISPQYFQYGSSFAWYERTADPSPSAPQGAWTYHLISNTLGGGFAIEPVADLHGDGVTRWVGTNHVSTAFNSSSPASGVFQLDPGPVVAAPWNATLLSSGIQGRSSNPTLFAPGVLGAGDIDGDGDVDLAVAGDGDARLFWLRQNADHSFTTYVIADAMGQAGGAIVRDLDGDGHTDLVFSSYEADTLRIYSAP